MVVPELDECITDCEAALSEIRDREAPVGAWDWPVSCVAVDITTPTVAPLLEVAIDVAGASALVVASFLDSGVLEEFEPVGGLRETELNFSLSPAEMRIIQLYLLFQVSFYRGQCKLAHSYTGWTQEYAMHEARQQHIQLHKQKTRSSPIVGHSLVSCELIIIVDSEDNV